MSETTRSTTHRPTSVGARLALAGSLVVGALALAASPASASTATAYGRTISGSIAVPREKDTYTFEGKRGDRLSIDVRSGSPSLRFRLTAWDGRTIWNDDNYIDRFEDLPVTGRYTLRVAFVSDMDHHTGSYRFAINNVKNPQRFTTGFGATIRPGYPAPGAANIELPGASDQYRFKATKGNRLVFDDIEGSEFLKMTLVAPNGQVVVDDGTYMDRRITLTQTGVWTIRVSMYHERYTGIYRFQIRKG